MTWKNAPLVDAAPAWASAPEVDVGSTSKPAVAPVTEAKDPGMFKYLPKFLQDQPFLKLLNAATPPISTPAAGMLRGAGSIGATILSPYDYLTDSTKGDRSLNLSSLVKGVKPLSRNEQRRKDMDDALRNLTGADTNSLLYTGPKLGTEIAGTLAVGGLLGKGVSTIPEATTKAAPLIEAIKTGGLSTGGLTGPLGLLTRAAGGAITGGASAGLVNPDDAGTGAMIGGAFPVGTKMIGQAGKIIGGVFKPSANASPLVNEAISRNMPLGIADIAEGSFPKAVRSVLNDLPIIGRPGAAQKEAQQVWLNREVGKTFGVEADRLTPEVIQTAKDNFSSAYDGIWKNNILKVDDATLKSFNDVKKSARMLPAGERNRVNAMLQDLSQQVQKGEGGEFIPGEVAQRYRTTIKEMIDSSTGFLKKDLSNLKSALESSFRRSVSTADAALLTQTDKQYKAFKTVENMLNKGELGVAGREAGDIPAALLPEAVRQSYKTNPGKTELGKLSALGSKFMVDRVARTGGSTRALIQNSAIGSGLALGSYANPLVGTIALPAAYGLNKALNSSALASKAANFTTPQISPEILNALQKSVLISGSQ